VYALRGAITEKNPTKKKKRNRAKNTNLVMRIECKNTRYSEN